VQGALESVDGVESVKVDYSTKTATVTAKEGQEIDKEALMAALKTKGYEGKVAVKE
jgi:copper chaperone CopZ